MRGCNASVCIRFQSWKPQIRQEDSMPSYAWLVPPVLAHAAYATQRWRNRRRPASRCPDRIKRRQEIREAIDDRDRTSFLERGSRMITPRYANTGRARGARHGDVIDGVA